MSVDCSSEKNPLPERLLVAYLTLRVLLFSTLCLPDRCHLQSQNSYTLSVRTEEPHAFIGDETVCFRDICLKSIIYIFKVIFITLTCFVLSKRQFHHKFLSKLFKDSNSKMLKNVNFILVLNSLI